MPFTVTLLELCCPPAPCCWLLPIDITMPMVEEHDMYVNMLCVCVCVYMCVCVLVCVCVN